MKFVYFITEVGADIPVKIGVTNDAYSRIAGLSTGNYRGLEIKWHWHPHKDAEKDEKKIHEILAKHRIRGEWFNIHWEDALEELDEYYSNNDETVGVLDDELCRQALEKLAL